MSKRLSKPAAKVRSTHSAPFLFDLCQTSVSWRAQRQLLEKRQSQKEKIHQSPHSKQTSVASWRLTVGGRGDNSGCGSLITMCSQPVRRKIFNGFFDLRSSSAEEMLPCCDPTDQLQRPCWRSSHWPCLRSVWSCSLVVTCSPSDTGPERLKTPRGGGAFHDGSERILG